MKPKTRGAHLLHVACRKGRAGDRHYVGFYVGNDGVRLFLAPSLRRDLTDHGLLGEYGVPLDEIDSIRNLPASSMPYWERMPLLELHTLTPLVEYELVEDGAGI